MKNSVPLFLYAGPLLLVSAASQSAGLAEPAANAAEGSPGMKSVDEHCAPFQVDPARLDEHPPISGVNGREHHRENMPAGPAYGIAYLVDGCLMDVTPSGVQPLPPKGRDGRLIPLRPRSL